MTKKLNEAAIKNELEGSAFFQKPIEIENISDIKVIEPNPPVSSDTTLPVDQDTTPPRSHDTMTPRYHDDLIEDIRKAVKRYGKEAATYRFTTTEKQALQTLIYDYKKDGIRTSENEIARIAVNLIVLDHRNFGEDSILELILKRLND